MCSHRIEATGLGPPAASGPPLRRAAQPRDWPRLGRGGQGRLPRRARQQTSGPKVNPIIVEALGGITRRTRAVVERHARRAKGKGAIDRTKYGSTRVSPRSFLTHHLQQLSKAAVIFDAMAIHKQITSLKQRSCGAADAAAGGARA